jgi:NAD(P)-dependent dehydrogenase (short-subunit alcohol dehydrogenase family)
MRLKDTVAIVAGGRQGIGRPIANAEAGDVHGRRIAAL